MENLLQTIDKILEIEPEFYRDLKNIRSSVEFAAPEMENFWWRELAELLGFITVDHSKKGEIQKVFFEGFYAGE